MSEPKVTKQDVLNASQGMLQKQMYVYFTTPTKGLGPVLENLEPHLEFQRDLERKGIMFGAGPHWTDDEENWEGDGMVIIRAGSLAEAKEIAASDPMHRSGARSFTVRPWLMNEGTVTIKVSFADGKWELL